MSEKLTRFTKLLKEMFELDKSDLDFGIYRIMNIRKNEINNFIENTLTGEVNSLLAKFAVDNSQVKKRIEEIEKQCELVGVKVGESKLKEEYAEYKAQLSSGAGAAELESDVYSALYNFFSRYYDEGDFISKRRYKEGVYAIPYEGEEVKLYWANHDQYYIKSSENFRDYSFKVKDLDGKELTIHFKLVDASTEQNNNKENGDKKREFILLEDDFWEAQDNELTLKFEYRIAGDEQDKSNKLRDNSKLNKPAISKILEALSRKADLKPFYLAVNMSAPTEKNKNRTILEKHLEAYVSKNTFDYFIHKDLSGFLNRELDFYIKSEIMHLDDLDTENEVKVDAYLAKVKAIKKVGRTIIDFLAQIEEFQKKLWLKKKFVVETNWCITLDKIDESFYQEIAANDAQRQEWIELFAIDEIEGNLMEKGYSNPLTVEFLKYNKNLVLDTRHFSAYFKERLIASIDNLDEETDGLLIHSENFQALNLLQERYKEKVQCVYIDPPYNAKSSEILYKNGFKHSSWNSMIFNGLLKAKYLMSPNGIIEFAIDDYELKHSLLLLESVFGEENFIANIGIVHNPRGRNDDKFFGTSHEYMTVFAKNIEYAEVGLFSLNDEDIAVYNKTDAISNYSTVPYTRTGNNSYRFERPNLYYPIYYNPDTEELSLEKKDGLLELLPINPKGEEKTWRWGKDTFLAKCKTELVVKKDGEEYKIFKKRRLEGAGKKPKTIWADSKYDASSHGIMLLRNLFGLGNYFSYPKSYHTVYDALFLISEEETIVLDHFAGSGTTGHAVINLNREDEGNRKYILVEMGEYFNTVTKPRIKKVIYSKDWKEGKPQSMNTGVSQIFKYMRLEGYEDTLNNIEFSRTPEQEKQLSYNTKFFNEYLVSYMLDMESRDSLLNLDQFKKPFDYKLKITQNNEAKETTIDLVETFNYLLGLTVTTQGATASFDAAPDKNGEYENAVKLVMDKFGRYSFKTIEGMLPDGCKALIIWRNLTDDLTADNAALDAFFMNYCIDAGTRNFDVIYVNGDNNLENLRKEKEQWKVHLIELEFKKRMFEEV